VTKRTYRALRAIWIIGSAVLVAAVVGGWLHVVPFGLFLLLIIVVGGPAAFAAWVLQDQNFEELPD
jgi:uncharacterized membrane protein YbaN (DUF454 family)